MKIYLMLLVVLLSACKTRQNIDLIVYNSTIYTVDDDFSKKEAMAVNEGKIVETGNYKDLTQKYKAIDKIDLKGQFVYPGFYDGHCHFLGYGLSLQKADLTGTTSFEEVVEKLVQHDKQHNNDWVIGRGWDQNDWPGKKFPTNALLDIAFPKKPVFITRIDGHAAIANSAALKSARVTTASSVSGGDILVEDEKLTGVLIDNAMQLISEIIPVPTPEEKKNALVNAQKRCFAVGLTSVSDAGLSAEDINIIQTQQNEGTLKMRVYAMLYPSEENIEKHIKTGIIQDEKLTVRSIKLYADGALGSRGALMLKPYSDDPENFGLQMEDESHYEKYCQLAFDNNYQVNTHCIGDSANHFILKIYGNILKGNNDRRWRIEHSQVVHANDFSLFKKYNIIPSIQTTHATSDMYWAEERVGPERIKGAYAYQTLLAQNGWLINGSDFPVEPINPLLGFYAAVARQDTVQFPENGFQKNEGLSREQALRSMTIWPARGGFEDEYKGSLEPGKLADFVILSEDLMHVDLYQVPRIKIRATYFDGKIVYAY